MSWLAPPCSTGSHSGWSFWQSSSLIYVSALGCEISALGFGSAQKNRGDAPGSGSTLGELSTLRPLRRRYRKCARIIRYQHISGHAPPPFEPDCLPPSERLSRAFPIFAGMDTNMNHRNTTPDFSVQRSMKTPKKAANGQFLLGALALSLAALFTGCSSTTTQTAAEPGTTTPIAAELKPLQGYWEGDGAGGKCSITITGNSLHYRAGTNWFATTFTLPAGTDPQQLQATIKDSSPPTNNAIGKVVFAIFKIEDGTLTLAEDDMSDAPPKTFPSASSRYNVKKVQPQRTNAEASTSK